MSLKNLLKKILPPENTEFFNNFIEAANIAKETADLYLNQLTNNSGKDISQEVSLKEKSAVIVKNTYTMLNNSFITPIDREDIIYMSFALNKITKRIFRGIMSSKLYNLKEVPSSITEQAKNLIFATEELIHIVSILNKNSNVQELADANHKMTEIELKGDKIFYKGMEELFSGKYDALEVIKLRDIYKAIESALDNCSHVAETVANIVFKQS